MGEPMAVHFQVVQMAVWEVQALAVGARCKQRRYYAPTFRLQRLPRLQKFQAPNQEDQ
jgi:hypothetical protein